MGVVRSKSVNHDTIVIVETITVCEHIFATALCLYSGTSESLALTDSSSCKLRNRIIHSLRSLRAIARHFSNKSSRWSSVEYLISHRLHICQKLGSKAHSSPTEAFRCTELDRQVIGTSAAKVVIMAIIAFSRSPDKIHILSFRIEIY